MRVTNVLAMLLLATAISGCWDMHAIGWNKAVELCAGHGGPYAADETSMASGGFLVAVQCVDRVNIRALVKGE
jgi:hypothetical protein